MKYLMVLLTMISLSGAIHADNDHPGVGGSGSTSSNPNGAGGNSSGGFGYGNYNHSSPIGNQQLPQERSQPCPTHNQKVRMIENLAACKEASVVSLCTQAGYDLGEARIGTGLRRNCLKPLSEGMIVPGVTSTEDLTTAATNCLSAFDRRLQERWPKCNPGGPRMRGEAANPSADHQMPGQPLPTAN